MKMMDWVIMIFMLLVVGLMIVVGISIFKTGTIECNTLDVSEIHLASCDKLVSAYGCCMDKSITVHHTRNCHLTYSAQIAKKCS